MTIRSLWTFCTRAIVVGIIHPLYLPIESPSLNQNSIHNASSFFADERVTFVTPALLSSNFHLHADDVVVRCTK